MRLLIAVLLSISTLVGAPVYVEGLALTGPLTGSDVGEPRPLPLLQAIADSLPASGGERSEVSVGVLITCSPGPRSMNSNLPKHVIRWSCGIHNRGTEPRDITEAMMVTAMLSAGVGAIDSVSISTHRDHEGRMGFWSRAGLYTSQAPRPLITAIALGLLKVQADEAVIIGALDQLLPFMSQRFLERAEILPVPMWTEPVNLPPGQFILRHGYSSEWEGPVPVQVMIP